MFKILYRIIDHEKKLENTDELYDVHGYLEIHANDKSDGRYHDGEVGIGDPGDYWIGECLLQFVKAGIHLHDNPCFSFHNIDNIFYWYEVKREKENIIFSMLGKDTDGLYHEITYPIYQYETVMFANEIIKYSEFKEEITKKTESFLNELHDINPKLLTDRENIELREKIEVLKNLSDEPEGYAELKNNVFYLSQYEKEEIANQFSKENYYIIEIDGLKNESLEEYFKNVNQQISLKKINLRHKNDLKNYKTDMTSLNKLAKKYDGIFILIENSDDFLANEDDKFQMIELFRNEILLDFDKIFKKQSKLFLINEVFYFSKF